MKFRHPTILRGGISHPVHGHMPIVGGVFEAPVEFGLELGLAPILDTPVVPEGASVPEAVTSSVPEKAAVRTPRSGKRAKG